MTIKIISDQQSKFAGDLIALLHQQMIDIGSPKTREEIERAVANAVKPEARAFFFVLYDGADSAIGMAFGNICAGIESGGDYLWLNEIQIAPAFRNQGYGEKLLNFVIDWAKKNGCVKILGVTAEANTIAQHFFDKNHFAISTMMWLDHQLNPDPQDCH